MWLSNILRYQYKKWEKIFQSRYNVSFQFVCLNWASIEHYSNQLNSVILLWTLSNPIVTKLLFLKPKKLPDWFMTIFNANLLVRKLN